MGVKMRRSIVTFLAISLSVAALLAAPADAQESSVSYLGNFGGGGKGCPLAAQEVQVTINGSQVNGYWVDPNGSKPRFKGEMKGASFKVIRESKAGNQSSIAGELINNNLEVRFVGPKCSYRAVLKKQA